MRSINVLFGVWLVLITGGDLISSPNVLKYNCPDLPVSVSPNGSVFNQSESGQWYLPAHDYTYAALLGVDDYVEFELLLPQAGTYAIQVENRRQQDNGIYRLEISADGAVYNLVGDGMKYDQGNIFADPDLQMANFGVHSFETRGTKRFRFRVSGKNPESSGYDLTLSDIVLTEVQAIEIGGRVALEHINDQNSALGYHYEIDSGSTGDIARYGIDIEEPGFYVVLVRNVNGPDRGIYQVLVDGKPYGEPVDQYAKSRSYSLSNHGILKVDSPGKRFFDFEVIGKNSLSSGYSLGLDFIRLADPDLTVTSGWGMNAEHTKGWWPTSTHADNYFGRFYRFARPGLTRFYRELRETEVPDVIAWKPWQPDFMGFLVSGYYNVYYWLPDGAPDRASNAQYTVYHKGGTTTYKVDQRNLGGEWILLGRHYFSEGRAGRSGYVELTNEADGIVISDSIRFEYASEQYEPPEAPGSSSAKAGEYRVRHDQRKQTVWGLGVEIQPEANKGRDFNRDKGIPEDLVVSERNRYYNELLGLGNGFRYLRFPVGLFYTGLDDEGKQFQQRWSTQNKVLSEMIEASGVEGLNFEYWSPAPYFKSTGRLTGGSLRRFEEEFLYEFAESIVADLQYVNENIGPVKMFSLQNEPNVSQAGYGSCEYSNQEYYDTFRRVGPIIKDAFPNLHIHADSQVGQYGRGSELIRNDPDTLRHVDGWSWHRQGKNSNEQIRYVESKFRSDTEDRPVFNVEWQYPAGAGSAWRTVNTAQSIMNWFAFVEAPTWFWLHALKPTNDLISERFGLGFWRPSNDNDFTRYADIKKGHWEYNWYHWNALAGFLKYMPWDSVVYEVEEDEIRMDNRILAWKTPAGGLVLALTNRSADTPFVFDIDVGLEADFRGYRYSSETRTNEGVYLGSQRGSEISCELPPFSIEFWVQTPSEFGVTYLDFNCAASPNTTLRWNDIGGDYEVVASDELSFEEGYSMRIEVGSESGTVDAHTYPGEIEFLFDDPGAVGARRFWKVRQVTSGD